jgi:hypothetical protein
MFKYRVSVYIYSFFGHFDSERSYEIQAHQASDIQPMFDALARNTGGKNEVRKIEPIE